MSPIAMVRAAAEVFIPVSPGPPVAGCGSPASDDADRPLAPDSRTYHGFRNDCRLLARAFVVSPETSRDCWLTQGSPGLRVAVRGSPVPRQCTRTAAGADLQGRLPASRGESG